MASFQTFLFAFTLLQSRDLYSLGFTACFNDPSIARNDCERQHRFLSTRVVTRCQHHQEDQVPAATSNRRRDILGGMAIGLSGMAAFPLASEASYVLDDETGDFVEVEDVEWQEAWKQRLDKASSMSQGEIFQAARGAGNVNLKEGDESEASKKRRALSGCRDAKVRSTAKAGSERECVARVLGGDYQFVVEAL